jgi:glycosyltransferase involved in cell wall biosynthesis
LKVSVIIPCRNEEKYIDQTLRSLISQKDIPGDFEIIVVDGMSEDRTRQIVYQLQNDFPKIKLVDNEKRVTPTALNIGIKESIGDYICILGAHSIYSEDYISSCLKLFSEHPEVACVGGPIISIGEGNFSSAVAIAMASPIGVGNAKHRFPYYEGYAEMACFPMFRKSVVDRIGFYDEGLIKNQDDDFCFRLRKSGEKIYISPLVEASYYVRNTPNSLFNQYYQYGLWRVAVTKKHKIPISIRQLIPSFFLLAVVLSFIVGMFLSSALIMFIIPAVYLIILLGFSIVIIIKKSFFIGINILPALMILHFSYGIGFFSGIYKFRKISLTKNE